jgi:hypothetical protein
MLIIRVTGLKLDNLGKPSFIKDVKGRNYREVESAGCYRIVGCFGNSSGVRDLDGIFSTARVTQLFLRTLFRIQSGVESADCRAAGPTVNQIVS